MCEYEEGSYLEGLTNWYLSETDPSKKAHLEKRILAYLDQMKAMMDFASGKSKGNEPVRFFKYNFKPQDVSNG